MHRRFMATCCFMTASLTSALLCSAADWPQWRGPQRDGRAAETGLRDDWSRNPPRLAWMVDGMGRGYASMAVVKGVLYTTGDFHDGQGVIAVNAATGETLWRRTVTGEVPRHGYEGSRCTPTVDGDRLFVVMSNGAIACLEAADGDVVWRRDFVRDWQGRMMSGWGFSESPLVDGDRVLCTPGGEKAMVVALDRQSGRELWKCAAPRLGDGKPGAGYSSIVVSHAAGVKQYVQLTGRGLIGVRADDGKLLWNYGRIANSTANIPTPLVSGDHIFTSTGYQTGAALLKLRRDGAGVAADEVYFLPPDVFQNHHGQMVLHDGYVYAGNQHRNGFPICLELETGKVMWGGRIRGPGQGSAAITFVDGRIIFRYENGTVALIAASPDKYRLLGTFQPKYQADKSWSHPVVVNGKLYLREQDKLMCYDLGDS